MNEQVKAYLDQKQAEERKRQEAYRREVLTEAGLVERTYFEGQPPQDDEQFYEKYPYWDEDQGRYYNAEPLDVTDEEFTLIEKAAGTRMPREEATGMFGNIGSKIKGVAQVVCWAGIVISILVGIVTLLADDDLALVGLLTAVLGSLGSWVGSLFLYGFGELIDKATEIAANTQK